MKKLDNQTWTRHSQKLLNCIRSCETLMQLHVCGIMYARLVKNHSCDFSQVERYTETVLTLHLQIAAKKREIIQSTPNAVEISLLPKYRNRAQV